MNNMWLPKYIHLLFTRTLWGAKHDLAPQFSTLTSLQQPKKYSEYIRGIRTLEFSRKTTNAVLSGLQIVDVVK